MDINSLFSTDFGYFLSNVSIAFHSAKTPFAGSTKDDVLWKQ